MSEESNGGGEATQPANLIHKPAVGDTYVIDGKMTIDVFRDERRRMSLLVEIEYGRVEIRRGITVTR